MSVYSLYYLDHNLSKLSPAAAAKSLQSCRGDPRDRSPPGSPVPGILQARTLEWVAISFSNVWKWKVKVKSLSPVRLFATPRSAAYQAPPSVDFFFFLMLRNNVMMKWLFLYICLFKTNGEYKWNHFKNFVWIYKYKR